MRQPRSLTARSLTGRYVFLVACLAGIAVLIAVNQLPAIVAQSSQTTEQIDVSSAGLQSNSGIETEIAMSANGRYVAFSTFATNLVPDNQIFNLQDIYIRDRIAGSTEVVSLNSNGVQSNGISIEPSVSADGRFVAFTSDATNLVPGDTNQCFYNLLDESFLPGDCPDVFVRDRVTGVTERVSVGSNGQEGNDISSVPVISGDGRYVFFISRASNFYPGDGPASGELFMHDRQTGTTERILKPAAHGDYTITPDARYIAYLGTGNGGYAVFVYDRQTGTNELVSVPLPGKGLDGQSTSPAISADGRYVAFSSYATVLVSGDTNRKADVFVRDRVARTTERVSLSSLGAQANGDSHSFPFPNSVAMSADGRFVGFSSSASNLVPGDTNTCSVQYYYSYTSPGQCPDIFVRDRQEHTTTRVSVNNAGGQTTDVSFQPLMGSDGTVITFLSLAKNLAPGGTIPCSAFPFRVSRCSHVFTAVSP
jgi:Tol biopolymer transport system component